MAKVRKNITLDEELVELAEINLTIPLSTFLNNVLIEHFKTSDELEEVKKEIRHHEASLSVLRPKECRLEQQKMIEINNRNLYSSVHETLVNMQEANGCIGKNQIRGLARIKELNFEGLLKYCEDEGFKVVDYFNPEPHFMKGKYRRRF